MVKIRSELKKASSNKNITLLISSNRTIVNGNNKTIIAIIRILIILIIDKFNTYNNSGESV